eukprot:gene10226-12537_t
MTPDIEEFVQKKDLLVQAEKDGLILQARPANRGVGLINSGSTCYLNSVLQCLVEIPELVQVISKEAYQNIPTVRELVRLFSELTHSSKNAVKTTALLDSFGWTASQKHEQHDANEFFELLCASIGQSSPELEKELCDLFNGTAEDTITCQTCQTSSTTQTSFRTLALSLPEDEPEPPAEGEDGS